MSSGHSNSFRLKRNNSDSDSVDVDNNSNNNKRKHNHSFTNLFRRKDKRDSLTKSQSMRIKSRDSLDINALNATKPNSRIGKSISVPNNLTLKNSTGTNRTFTINGEQLDLSKVPPLPPMNSLEATKSKQEEFNAVRRKLIGSSQSHSPRRMSYYNTEEDEDEDEDSDKDYEDEDFDIGSAANSTTNIDPNDNQNNSKHHDFLHNKLNGRLTKRHPKSLFTLQSSSHQSSSSLTEDETINPASNGNSMSENEINNDSSNQHNGLFSTLMNTLNLKSFQDLTRHGDIDEDEDDGTELDDHTISSSISSQANPSPRNEALDAVKFIPVKKALITTLGQGSLSLDAFPKNQTQLLTDQKHLSIPEYNPLNTSSDGKTNSTININKLQLPHNEDMVISASEGFLLDNNNQENIKSLPLTSRARSSMSPLPRKQTIRNSLSSILSEEEEGGGGAGDNLASSVLMANSMSLKKKLKLPLPSNRKSYDSVASVTRITSNPGVEDYLDGDPESKKKDFLFDKLDIKAPSDKRQEAFHALFSSLPANEVFIEDFACAYRKEILVQGRLYLSEHHISFHSNIIGLVTRLTIPLNAILKIQKKKTVGIPNAIEFSNLHNKYIFASFMSRDPTYSLISKVWKANINSDGFDTIDLDIDDDVDSLDSVSINDSDDDDGDENTKSHRKTDATVNTTENNNNNNNNNNNDDSSDTSISDQEDMVKEGADDNSKDTESTTAVESENAENLFNGLSFEGPKTHAPTSNGYTAESSDTKIIEETIPAPLGVVYNLMFGEDVTFLKNLLKVQKNYDIGDIPKFSGNKRLYQYTKPINGGPVGPKQTKCIVEEAIDHKDFSKNCLVYQITESPDVPSGNAFKVKTKVYLSWGPNNSTTFFVATTIVWTGKSWIKGAIERGTISGQKEAMGIAISELKKKIASGGSINSSPSKSKKKDKGKKHTKEETSATTVETPTEVIEPVRQPEQKSYLDLIIEQFDFKLFLIVVLFAIVLTEKFKSHKKSDGYELYSNNRMLMSESSLWEWIEQRELMSKPTEIDGVKTPSYSKKSRHRNRFREPLEKAGKRKMSEQELKDTIEMMEMQLSKLKEREISHSNII